MVTYYNKKDLVSFGNYLLSEKRTNLIKSHPEFVTNDQVEDRLRQVSHADYENWRVYLQNTK